MMGSVFMSWTREAILGSALRYCEYAKTDDQCVYCCLEASLKQFKDMGFKYSLSVRAQAWQTGCDLMNILRSFIYLRSRTYGLDGVLLF